MKRNQVQSYGTISEMAASPKELAVEIPLADGVDIEKLTEGDSDPLFVTLEALSPGVSVNKRHYSLEEVQSIAEQVNKTKPNAYLGHLDEKEKKTKYPDPVVIWVGAKVVKYKGKDRLFIKGYVLPEAKSFKTYLRKAAAAGKNVAVSIFGDAYQIWKENLKAYDIRDFDLQSIDFARHLSEGVPNSGFLKLTAETNQGEEDLMDREEVLKSATVSEMREVNPSFITEVETGLRSENEELKSTVSEMQGALGVEDAEKAKERVAEMQEELASTKTTLAEMVVDRELAHKVPSVEARKGLRKMVISEMKDTDPEAVKTLIAEMLDGDMAKALIASATPSVVTPGGGNNNRHVEAGSSQWLKGKRES